jgi:hypothetical protein
MLDLDSDGEDMNEEPGDNPSADNDNELRSSEDSRRNHGEEDEVSDESLPGIDDPGQQLETQTSGSIPSQSSGVESATTAQTLTSNQVISGDGTQATSTSGVVPPCLTSSFNEGSYYQVKLDDGTQRIIFVHRHNQETNILSVTNYLSEKHLRCILQENPRSEEEHERFFMMYKDWMVAGEVDDAEELPKSRITEISQDIIRIQVSDGDDHAESQEDNASTYTVEWGIKVEAQLYEVRSLHNAKDEVSNYPNDIEILEQGDVAYYIGSGIPGWPVGFQNAGYKIPVAVIANDVEAQMWRVIPPGISPSLTCRIIRRERFTRRVLKNL